ncbi:MAG TPA: hypothetical protein VGI33_01330 [Paenibacillus sp.]
MIDPKLLVVDVGWVIGFVLKQKPRVLNWSIVYRGGAGALAVLVTS